MTCLSQRRIKGGGQGGRGPRPTTNTRPTAEQYGKVENSARPLTTLALNGLNGLKWVIGTSTKAEIMQSGRCVCRFVCLCAASR